LTLPGTQVLDVPGAKGGIAVFTDFFTQPAGTRVFDPFLTIEQNSAGKAPTNNKYIEQGYNTAGHGTPPAGQTDNLFMDQQRPEWNTVLRLRDLAQLSVAGHAGKYYGFELDANEPGGTTKDPKNLISIDNVRIYTSKTDRTALVQDDLSKLDLLGDNNPVTLRWALNDPTKTGSNWNINNWVKLDAEQENVGSVSNGGSGKSDMIVYIPVTAFAGASPDDYLWFWNLNGVHYSVDTNGSLPGGTIDGLAAQAGYEEWRAVKGPQQHVPDGGATIALLGVGLLGLGAMRRKLS